jgi:tyrosyl-tRNA synthetase
MTSPYKFYQFFLNQSDEDSPKLLRVFSLKTKEEIEALEAEHLAAPHLRLMQKALAEELTERIHSKEDLENAQRASNILFGKDVVEDLKKSHGAVP